MPLSEHEQRVLHELEQALYRQDPAFAARVRNRDVRHLAARYVWMSAAAFVFGLVFLVATFTVSPVLGFLGVAIMFVSLVSFWTNVRRLGRPAPTAAKATAESMGKTLANARTRLRSRFRKQP